MKILQLCNKFTYPPKDGGAIGIYNYTKAFSLLGHDVTVLAMNTSKHYYDITQLPNDVKNLAHWEAVEVDNKVRPAKALLCLLRSQSYHIERFISSNYNDKLIQLLHQNEFDIIQLEGLYLSPYVETLRAFSDVKIVMRSHNIEHEIWQRIAQNEKNGVKKWYLNVLAKQLKYYEIERLNRYDMITSVTERDGELLKKFGCKLPMHICPAPYDETVIKPDKTNVELPSLYFIGALDWMPNQEGLAWFLTHVWDSLNKKYPNLKCYIAGRYAEKFEIPANTNKSNLVFVGEVDDAYSFMNSKGIMIVPLLSGSGIRVKIIEGMALGKTIVSTSLGAEGIPCKDGQNILLADTAELFLEKISKCLDEKIYFSIVGENAYQFVKQRYSSKEVAGKLVEFYKQHMG